MGSSTGEQVQHLLPLQCSKSSDQISFAGHPVLQMSLHAGCEMVSGFLEVGVRFRQQIKSGLDPGGKALLELWIGQQRKQRWRQADREPG